MMMILLNKIGSVFVLIILFAYKQSVVVLQFQAYDPQFYFHFQLHCSAAMYIHEVTFSITRAKKTLEDANILASHTHTHESEKYFNKCR